MIEFLASNWVEWPFATIAVLLILISYISLTSGQNESKNVLVKSWITLVIGLIVGTGFLIGLNHDENVGNSAFDHKCHAAHGIVVGNPQYCVKGKVLFERG